jgi:hypothetical protein
MSASMPTAATQPTPGAAAGASGAAASQGAQAKAQAQSPLGVFEALLAAIAVNQGAATAVATQGATAASGKPADGEKGPTSDAAKGDEAAAQGADATNAATTPPDSTLALLISPIVAIPIATTAASTAGATGANAPQTKTETQAQVAAATAAGGALTQPAAGASIAATDPNATKDALAQAHAGALAAAAPSAAATLVATTAAANRSPVAALKVEAPQVESGPSSATPAADQPTSPLTTALAAAPVASAAAKPPAPAATAGVSNKTDSAKGVRVDGVRVDAVAQGPASSAAPGQLQIADDGDQAPSREGDPQAPIVEAKADQSNGAQPAANFTTSAAATPTTLAQAAAVPVHASPETVASLAARIAKKLDARTTNFDIQLDPAGLGKVNVHVQIGSDGKMSAAMLFDTPQAAAELRARAGELHRAMEQSGFDLTGGMSFDVSSGGGQGGRPTGQDTDSGATFRGRAFQQALDTTADAPLVSQLYVRQASQAGIDIRI